MYARVKILLFLTTAYWIGPVLCSKEKYDVPSWCVLMCHYQPNYGHDPDLGHLDVQNIPAEFCTHLVYESAHVDAGDMKVKPRNALAEVYQSGQRLFTWLNKLKLRYASLATLLAVDFPCSQEFQAALSFQSSRTTLIDSVYSLLESNEFDGVVLRLPQVPKLSHHYVSLARDLHEKRSGRSFMKKQMLGWIVASVPRRRANHNGKVLTDMSRYLDMLILSSDENNGTYAAYAVDPIKKPSGAFVDNSVESTLYYLSERGLPVSKLVLGLSTRPHVFTLRDTLHKQIGSPTTFDSPRLTTYRQACQYNLKAHLDERAMVKYASLGADRWISFNDVELITKKTEWLQERGLRGLSLYPINADDSIGVCHPQGGSFPLLRAAFDNLHCLDLSMPMYEEVALPPTETLTEQLDEVPCVRLCSVNHTRLPPGHDISPALQGACTHLIIGPASLDRQGRLEINDPLKEIVRSWNLVKSRTTALLLTIDGKSLAGVEHFKDENTWLESTQKVMDRLGLEGLGVNLDIRQGHVPIGTEHLVERLSSKLHKIKNVGNGIKKILVITTTVDTLYARQVDWVRLSKFADFLSVGGTMDMMLGDDFNRLIRDYYIDRHKLLLGVDAPVARKYHYEEDELSPESTEEMCRRFTALPNDHVASPWQHDTISTVRRKARLATMKNFAGVSLSNLESDDPDGRCRLGSKFPLLHTVMNNQLCDCNNQKFKFPGNCRTEWRVQCYYEPEMDGLQRWIDQKLLLKRCTHLAVTGSSLLLSADHRRQVQLDVSAELQKLAKQLYQVRSSNNVSLILVVHASDDLRDGAQLQDATTRDNLVDDLANALVNLKFDGVEFHVGKLLAADYDGAVVKMLRTLKRRLAILSASRHCEYEMSYAVESELLHSKDHSVVDTMDRLFDYITILSFKHRLAKAVTHVDLISRLSIVLDEVINRVIKAGLSKDKIVLALPMFGTQYNLLAGVKSPVLRGRDFKLNQFLKFYNATGYRTMRQVCTGIVNKRMRKGLCLDSIIAYAFNENELLVHESPETMLLKSRYARVKQLRGIALYTLNMDDRGVVCTGEPYPMLSAATLDTLKAN